MIQPAPRRHPICSYAPRRWRATVRTSRILFVTAAAMDSRRAVVVAGAGDRVDDVGLEIVALENASGVVLPDMVVMKNIERTAPPDVYTGYDTSLSDESTMRLAEDGNLDVMVKGTLGRASFRLKRREMGHELALAREMNLLAGNGRAAAPSAGAGAGFDMPPAHALARNDAESDNT
jgi:hypothetical protein